MSIEEEEARNWRGTESLTTGESYIKAIPAELIQSTIDEFYKKLKDSDTSFVDNGYLSYNDSREMVSQRSQEMHINEPVNPYGYNITEVLEEAASEVATKRSSTLKESTTNTVIRATCPVCHLIEVECIGKDNGIQPLSKWELIALILSEMKGSRIPSYFAIYKDRIEKAFRPRLLSGVQK